MKSLRKLLSTLFPAISLLFYSSLAQAASQYGGSYTGYVYDKISGNVSFPETTVGAAGFSVDDAGNITGSITGTVNNSGYITWSSNANGFTDGYIISGVLTATNVQNDNGTISTFRIAATNGSPGFGSGGTVAQSFSWRAPTPLFAALTGVTYGGGKFVAVGNGGTVAISTNGTNWSAGHANTTAKLGAIAYGNGTYVAVGDVQLVISSTDATNWTTRSVPGSPGQNMTGVAFGNGTFVAVDLPGEIFTSPDGISWTKVQAAGSPAWYNVKFGNGLFVATGAPGSVRTSTDGTTWNPVQTVAGASVLTDVAYGNGRWAALVGAGGGSGSAVFTTTTASDLTSTNFGSLGDAIGFVNGLFVTDGRFYSTDGLNWNRGSYPNIDVADMAAGNGVLVAVGAAITTTEDGKVWTVRTMQLPLGTVNNVGLSALTGDYFDETNYNNFQGNGRFVRVGLNGLIQTKISPSGVYSNSVSPTTNHLREVVSFPSGGAVIAGDNGTLLRYGGTVQFEGFTNVASGTTANLHSAAVNDPIGVVVGDNGTILRTANAGVTWSTVASGTTANLNRVAYLTGTGFNYWIAVGDNGKILKSTDGSAWTVLTTGSTKRLVGIGNRTLGTVKLVAMADDSTVLASDDHGVNWRSIIVNAPYAITYADSAIARGVSGIQIGSNDGTNWSYSLPAHGNISALAQGNGRTIALGSAYEISTDLDHWTAVQPLFQHTGLAFGAGLFVSVGSADSTGVGAICTSVDGMKWTPRIVTGNPTFTAVTYGGGKFAAVGLSGKIFSSPDGITWTDRSPAGAQNLNAVTYGGGKFVAAGDSGAFRYSSDGITWSTASSGGNLRGVTYGNGLFVAVGDSGGLRTSPDGATWTQRISGAGSTGLKAIAYTGSLFILVGDVEASGALGSVISTSLDGTNWTKDNLFAPVTLTSTLVGNGVFVVGGSSGTLFSAPILTPAVPSITSQPTPTNNVVSGGATVTYTVAASGSGLQYQWFKDGSPLANGPGVSGSTAATLTLSGVDVLDTGVYYVSVFNANGSDLSQPLRLDVNSVPIITVPPATLTVTNNVTTNFTVAATGPGPYTYQWRKNGQPLSEGGHYIGTTTSHLIVGPANGVDEASYDVLVSNSYGPSAPSAAAMLFVKRPPTITNQPVAVNITQGQTIMLTVGVDGFAPLRYQWRHGTNNLVNGGNVSGATNDTLIISNATVADGGQYSVVVTNGFNPGATSSVAYVSVLGPGAFHPGLTFNGSGTIYDIAPASDGNYLVGGDVSVTIGSTSWIRLLKLDSNGVINTNFVTTNNASSPNGTVRTIAEQPDGQLLVGGIFSWGGNAQYAYAVRLAANGTLDPNYKPGLSWQVRKIVPVANNRALIARTGLGFSTSWVQRYTDTGVADPTFSEITNLNRELFGLRVQTNGTIWETGAFGLKKSGANGTNPTNVATYAPFPEMAYVHVGPDDKIYYSDNNGQYFGRLNSDGSRDLSFSNTINGHVIDMAFLDNGKMVIVGDFLAVNSNSTPYIAMLDNFGASVPGFTSPYTNVGGNLLNTIQMLSDGSAFVGGNVILIPPASPTTQRYLQRIQITNPAASGSTYAQWAAGKGLPPGLDGPGDDADGDGFKNAAEYAFGTDPITPGSKPLFSTVTVNNSGSDYPAVRFTLLKGAGDVGVTVKAANDLTFASPIATTRTEVDNGSTIEVTIRSNTPKSGTSQVFFQIVAAGTTVNL